MFAFTLMLMMSAENNPVIASLNPTKYVTPALRIMFAVTMLSVMVGLLAVGVRAAVCGLGMAGAGQEPAHPANRL